MPMMPIPNEIVRAYLLNQPNEAEGYPTDAAGRFLSPLDEVYYGFQTDEGPEVLILATVVAVLDNHSVVKNNSRFASSFGIEHCTVMNRHIIRLPPPLTTTRAHLLSYFNTINTLTGQSGDFHIRGRSIC